MRTILGIWAHPDDEVFTSGGLMADAVANGDRVVCLHLTRGEAGLYHRDSYPADVVSAVRSRELANSLACIGVTEQHFLDYSDGRLSLATPDDVIVRLHDFLVEVDPDVVITFGPDGFTGHPDHRSLSTWVTAAVRVWNKPRARVLHATVPDNWKAAVVARLEEFDFFWPGYPESIGRGDVSRRLDGKVLNAKIAALRAHSSQMEPLFECYGEDFIRSIVSTEVFRYGPRPAFRSRMLVDLRHA